MRFLPTSRRLRKVPALLGLFGTKVFFEAANLLIFLFTEADRGRCLVLRIILALPSFDGIPQPLNFLLRSRDIGL